MSVLPLNTAQCVHAQAQLYYVKVQSQQCVVYEHTSVSNFY